MEEEGRDPWLAESRVPELSNSETDELAKTGAVTLACLTGHFSIDELCDVVGNLIFCQLIRLLHFTKIDIVVGNLIPSCSKEKIMYVFVFALTLCEPFR